ncbi:MAG TPA: hypothetical protein VD971_10460 [Phycisphaerales bacterium]|nr:hypothetical protein [Phycisphaerales bacterium]
MKATRHRTSANAGRAARRAGRGAARVATLAAITAGVVVLAVLGVAFYGAKRGPRPVPAARSLPAPALAPQAQGAVGSLTRGDKFFVQFVDRDDPSRLAGEVTAARSTPGPASSHELESPDAWFYLRDGRSIQVLARTGVLTLEPGSNRPTAGTLRGDVHARLFALVPGGGRPRATATPLATLRTPLARVDWTLGELELPDAVEFQSEQVSFAGSGVTVDFDPEQQTLEALNIASTREVRVTDGPDTPGSQRSARRRAAVPASTSVPGIDATSAPTTPTAVEEAEPVEQMYWLMATGDVRATRGGAAFAAGEVQAWARVVDGRVNLGLENLTAPSQPSPVAAPAPATSTAEHHAAPPTPAGSPHEPVVVTWSGPLEVRRLRESPAELAGDDAAVKARGGTIAFDDTERGLHARTGELSVFLPSKRAAITGEGSRVWSDGSGAIAAGTIEADWASGVVRVPGAGVLELADGGSRPTVAWRETAEFALDAGRRHLDRAKFIGAVSGRDGERTANAHQMTAVFAEGGGRALRGAVLAGGASLADGDRAGVAADSIAVTLANSGGSTLPEHLVATGRAKARADGDSIDADRIEMTTKAGSDGAVSVTALTGQGGVAFASGDGARGGCEALAAWPAERRATLVSNAWLADATTRLASDTLALDGAAGTLRGDGGGNLTLKQPDGGEATVTWTDQIDIDDGAGTARIAGAVRAAGTDTRGGTNTIRADWIDASYTVTTDAAAPPTEPRGRGLVPAGSAERTLRTANAGAAGGRVVEVEMRRTDAGASGLLNVTGGRIAVDMERGRVEVPGAGALVSRRVGGEPTAIARSPLASDGAGDTVLRWADGAAYSWGDGRAAARGRVRMIHRRPDAATPDELECAVATASFGAGDTEGLGSLVSLEAETAVWMRSATREMTGQRVVYNARDQLAEASAGGGLVTVADADGSPPITARRLRWNLATGRVEVLEAGAGGAAK